MTLVVLGDVGPKFISFMLRPASLRSSLLKEEECSWNQSKFRELMGPHLQVSERCVGLALCFPARNTVSCGI